MPTPIRYPGGITNAAPFQTMAQAGIMDPSYYACYFNDFFSIGSTDFTVSDLGLATTAITAGNGGQLLTTTTTGATDYSHLQLAAATFAFTPATATVAGKKAFFKIYLKVSDSTNSEIYAGLAATGATPVETATEGLFFYKDAGAKTFVLRNIAGSTVTDLAIPSAVNVFADNTFIELGWYHDGKGTVYAFVNPSTGYYPTSGSGATNALSANKGAVASFTPAALSSANLNLSFGITNGAAASKTMTVDYVLAAVER